MLPHDFLGGAVQRTGATVVAQAGPLREDRVFGGGGERGDVGEPFEESFVVGDHGGHLRLLEHDLRDPDRVGVACAPPR